MERFRLSFVFPLVCLLFGLLSACKTAPTYKVTAEPTLEQSSAVSEEVCLDSFLFVSKRPCIYFRGEKDNQTGSVQYYLLYEMGTFEVDLPIGVSIKLGDVWYNLKKSNTDYSDTIVVSSSVTGDLIPKIGESKSIQVSYTSRKGTTNFQLKDATVSRFQSSLSKLIRALESEPKLIIQKK
jgi:hypothetical protein